MLIRGMADKNEVLNSKVYLNKHLCRLFSVILKSITLFQVVNLRAFFQMKMLVKGELTQSVIGKHTITKIIMNLSEIIRCSYLNSTNWKYFKISSNILITTINVCYSFHTFMKKYICILICDDRCNKLMSVNYIDDSSSGRVTPRREGYYF